jgi:hypothetical protein
METPSVQDQLKKLGATIVSADRRTPDYLAQFVKDELTKWSAPVQASGAVIE